MVKSSYVWVIVVPIVAKMLSHIRQDFALPIVALDVHIVIGVPFTWELLYYSAICFAIATLIYTGACPEIVQRYDKFSEFLAEGKGSDQLVSYAYGTTADRSKEVGMHRLSKPQLLRFLQKSVSTMSGIDPSDPKLMQAVKDHAYDEGFQPERVTVTNPERAFWFIRECLDSDFPAWRLAVECMYIVGFVLIGFVMLQNFCYVSQHFSISAAKLF